MNKNALSVEDRTRKKLEGLGITQKKLKHDIPNGDLSNCDLWNYDFSGIDLTDCKFSGSTINDCIFDKATITRALFNDTALANCSFKETKGYGASFELSMFLGGGDFSGSNLSFPLERISKMSSKTAAEIFDIVNERVTTFKNVTANQLNFDGCNLLTVNFDGAIIEETNFSDVQIGSSALELNAKNGFTMNLPQVQQGVILSRSTFNNAMMQRLTLRHCRLEMSNLSKCDLSALKLSYMTLWGVNFSHCDLSNMKAMEVIFDKTSIHFCDLANADLSKAISLETARLEGSTYNKNTKFPPGFEPTKHGLKLK